MNKILFTITLTFSLLFLHIEVFQSQTLRKLATDKGKYIGSAANSGVFYDTTKFAEKYRTIFAQEFNILVAENEMKMYKLQTSQGVFHWSQADSLIEFAEKNKMRVRGHTLVWHNQMSSFLKDTTKQWTKEMLLDVMKNHITTVVSKYKGRVHEWDVVNEAITDSVVADYRNSLWYKTIGSEFIDSAFVWAHRADPTAELYYNDYNIENFNSKAKFLLKMVGNLQKKGIPINGVGIQSHIEYNTTPAKFENLSRFIDSLSVLGLKIAFTELDLGIPADKLSSQAIMEQANTYEMITKLLVSKPAVRSMVLWGFTDKYTWLIKHNKKVQPLIFDAELKKKPAYDSIFRVLNN